MKDEQFKRANGPSFMEELAGKLKCAKCGYTIKSYSWSTNAMPYLSCPGKTLHKICDQSYRKVNFYDLQDAVGKKIQKYLNTIEERGQEKLNENWKPGETN